MSTLRETETGIAICFVGIANKFKGYSENQFTLWELNKSKKTMVIIQALSCATFEELNKGMQVNY